MTRDHEEPSAVERSLKRGIQSFEALVAGAEGLFPTEVLQFLEAHRTDDEFNRAAIESMISEARLLGRTSDLPQGHGLALPHPLDAEWRFTDATAATLLEMAIAATSPADPILLVGVPSVALAAVRRDDDRRYWVRGEQNIITDGVIRRTVSDRRFRHDQIDGFGAAAAIVDPPWYVPQFREMLGLASRYCRAGAAIFVTKPYDEVRPGIRDDLVSMAETASQAGLVSTAESKGAVTYRTPFFELNALRSAGIGVWLPEWRRGNIVTYEKRSPGLTWPASPKAPSFELTVSGIRIRLLGWEDDGVGDIIPLHTGGVFPSVSMRAPRRAEATLWTSGNRAFKAPRLLTLAAMLEIAALRQVLPKRLEPELSRSKNCCSVDAVEPLIQKLTELADREAAEAASLLGSAAWERSANDARFLNASGTACPRSPHGTTGFCSKSKQRKSRSAFTSPYS
jgi:hypothetical protein